MQEARFAIDEVLVKGNHYEHRLMDYNNDPKTAFADVQKFFTLIEERIKKRLATRAPFGGALETDCALGSGDSARARSRPQRPRR
jgi:hypothetical protein